MNTGIFTQVEQAVEDYGTCWGAFKTAQQEAEDIVAAVATRLAADRAAADERIVMLTDQSKDPARPEVVRKLAVAELERLQGRTIEPTADEISAFSAAMDDARAALRDARTLQRQLQDLFAEANKALSTLRAGTLGDQSRDAELAGRRLDGERRAFELLGKAGRHGGQT